MTDTSMTDMREHPIKQPIDSIVVELGAEVESYRVGQNGVSKIEAVTKSGLHADIPYLRVWRGDFAFAEFCQHHIIGVYFKAALAKSGAAS